MVKDSQQTKFLKTFFITNDDDECILEEALKKIGINNFMIKRYTTSKNEKNIESISVKTS